MTTITTTAPTISASGITAPAYADILAFLQSAYQGIYGSDVYLGNDSQDGQFLGVIANAINDANSVALLIYSSFSPSTAQNAALSSNVKINGLDRDEPSYSTWNVQINGQNEATINNGVFTDESGNRWDLPAQVVIPNTGSITVTATCETLGSIAGSPGAAFTIATPTLGWQTVTTTSSAAPGAPVETDAELKQRQSVSTSLPSQSILDGITGAVASLPGVTRYQAYENETGTTDANGIPAHSISYVIEGGQSASIASVIALKKTPGTGTYGTTSQSTTDAYGNAITINYFTPTEVPITGALALTALNGYSAAVGISVQNAISAYVNAVAIGGGDAGVVEWDACIAAAKSVPNSNTFRLQSLAISRASGAGAPDVPLAFNEAANCTPASIVLTVSG